MKPSLLVLAWLFPFFSLIAQQTIPYQTEFESEGGFVLGDSANGTMGWTNVLGNSILSNDYVASGSLQSLKLLPSSEVKIEFWRNCNFNVDYTDFWILGTGEDYPELDILTTTDSVSIGSSRYPNMEVFSLFVWDDDSGWVDGNADFTECERYLL